MAELSMGIGSHSFGILDDILNLLIGSMSGSVVSVDGLYIEAEWRWDDGPQPNGLATDIFYFGKRFLRFTTDIINLLLRSNSNERF